MNREYLYEEGIVLSCGEGVAEIVLIENDECGDCSAKLFCKPSDKDKKTLSVADSFGVHPGDEVRISIPGMSVFKISFLLYGVPLIILITAIFVGLQIFQQNLQKEFLSFLLGLVAMGIYFFFFFKFSASKKNAFEKPKIDFVKKTIRK